MYDRDELVAHAKQCYPSEACGVISNGKLIPIKNVSTRPQDGFVMCPLELGEIMDGQPIDAVFHSHPDDTASPSDHDIARMNRSENKVPWVIVSYPDVDITVTYPKSEPPLIGRRFVHGVDDCYGVVRDFYRKKLGIELTNYHRDDNWWEQGENLYLDNYEAEGFYEVSMDDLQYGDFILMQVLSNTVNHAAIYLGDGKILHHLYDRLSRVDIYGGYWLERTARTLRHKCYNVAKVLPLTDEDYADNY